MQTRKSIAKTGTSVLLGLALTVSARAVDREILTLTNVVVRVMAANLNGSSQKIEPFGIRTFQGLKPDIVCIQEFNYGASSTGEIRSFVDTAFGTNFYYLRESNSNGAAYQIPNGVISRYPFRSTTNWTDPYISNRGFACAQIDLPGPTDLYVVSVHLKASSGSANVTTRSNEALALKALIQSSLPTNAWIVVAGDMNLQSRSASEPALTIFKTFLSDVPIPVDQTNNPNTNAGRDNPYDLVLPSFSFVTDLVPVVIGAQSFPNGLVFDSRVFSPLSDVSPVQTADSGLGQHMGVLKDFRINYTLTNHVDVPRPVIVQSKTNSLRWATVPGITYTMQRSANLTNWTTATQFTASTTNAVFTNLVTAPPHQFYRVSF